MLFSEIYGSYFNVVAAVLAEASGGALTDRRLTELVREKAFAESVLAIPAALKSGAWPLLDGENASVLRHAPTMPLTTLQKRWLKALLQDPRIALFDPDPSGLEDVEPLYRPGTFVSFDRYADGDPYTDEGYVWCFRAVLGALRERRWLRLGFRGRTGVRRTVTCLPCRLEYSAKDDKFRLLAAGGGRTDVVNLARVYRWEVLEASGGDLPPLRERKRELVLLLRDERNALERALLHFSHLEKETRKLAGGLYELRLRCGREDETELLIRVLSFGPALEVLAPADFAARVGGRINQQLGLFSGPLPAAGGARNLGAQGTAKDPPSA